MLVDSEFDQIQYLMKMTRNLARFAYLSLEFMKTATCTAIITRYSKLKKERACCMILQHTLFDRIYSIFA